MNIHADKSSESKTESVANSFSTKKANDKPDFQFTDNRPQSVAQRKLRQALNSYTPAALQQQPVQRKMIFGNDTEDLDASKNDINYHGYLAVQNRAKAIEPVIILALGAASSAEQAKFSPYGKGGLINIKALPDESNKDYQYDKTARLIAVTHETQHALDHLDTESPIHGQLSKLSGKLGVRTELHAFAAQSAITMQLSEKQKPVERKLLDMAQAFIESTPESPTPYLLDLMKYYAWNYSNKFKEANPDYQKVKDTDAIVKNTLIYILEFLPESKAIYENLLKSKEAPAEEEHKEEIPKAEGK